MQINTIKGQAVKEIQPEIIDADEEDDDFAAIHSLFSDTINPGAAVLSKGDCLTPHYKIQLIVYDQKGLQSSTA